MEDVYSNLSNSLRRYFDSEEFLQLCEEYKNMSYVNYAKRNPYDDSNMFHQLKKILSYLNKIDNNQNVINKYGKLIDKYEEKIGINDKIVYSYLEKEFFNYLNGDIFILFSFIMSYLHVNREGVTSTLLIGEGIFLSFLYFCSKIRNNKYKFKGIKDYNDRKNSLENENDRLSKLINDVNLKKIELSIANETLKEEIIILSEQFMNKINDCSDILKECIHKDDYIIDTPKEINKKIRIRHR